MLGLKLPSSLTDAYPTIECWQGCTGGIGILAVGSGRDGAVKCRGKRNEGCGMRDERVRRSADGAPCARSGEIWSLWRSVGLGAGWGEVSHKNATDAARDATVRIKKISRRSHRWNRRPWCLCLFALSVSLSYSRHNRSGNNGLSLSISSCHRQCEVQHPFSVVNTQNRNFLLPSVT